MKAAGIKMRHLPTTGGGPALTALLGNNAQVLVSSVAAASAQIKAGKLRALACFGAKRAASLPDVPTLKELGYDVEFSLWVGLFAPEGHARRRDRETARRDRRRSRPATSSRRRSTNIGDDVAYLDQPEFKAVLGRGRQARRSRGAVDRQGGGLGSG